MITLKAPAKVNLCLRIYGKTDNGLHNLDSIVVFCEFGDKISISPADHDSFCERGPFAPSIAAQKKPENLVIAARDAFRANGGVCGPITIILDKKIPVGAGLGGGSADAAATLRALNKIASTQLSEDHLFAIASTLGSDVPVCLASTPHRIKGTGEVIHPLNKIHVGALLLVCPSVPLSTAAVFKQITPPYNRPLPDIIDLNAVQLCVFGNDLEAAATTLVPEINDLLTRLRETPTCHAAQMSGSGATCFGIFDDIDTASPVASQFEKDHVWAKVTKLHPSDVPTYSVLS
jgi:4-diphosphocytidyl-2-C-methyl-D-erythritol kinase